MSCILNFFSQKVCDNELCGNENISGIYHIHKNTDNVRIQVRLYTEI